MANYKQRTAHSASVMTDAQAARIRANDDWESYAAQKQRITEEDRERMRARRALENRMDERRLRSLLDDW